MEGAFSRGLTWRGTLGLQRRPRGLWQVSRVRSTLLSRVDPAKAWERARRPLLVCLSVLPPWRLNS